MLQDTLLSPVSCSASQNLEPLLSEAMGVTGSQSLGCLLRQDSEAQLVGTSLGPGTMVRCVLADFANSSLTQSHDSSLGFGFHCLSRP